MPCSGGRLRSPRVLSRGRIKVAAFRRLFARPRDSEIAAALDIAATQSSLLRLARLIADEARPPTIFAAITREALQYCRGSSACMIRYEMDDTATILANAGIWAPHRFAGQPLHRYPPDGLTACVRRFDRAVRIDDFGTRVGGEPYQQQGFRSVVGMPIHVHGRLWGMIAIGSASHLRPDAEEWMANFTELVSIAVANAQSRAELMASRARIVPASDEARRRIERDLHDGVQQRLVEIVLRLRVAANDTADSAPARSELDALIGEVLGVIEDLREISRGTYPAVLTEAGLGAGIRMLARRSTVPVHTEIRVPDRLPKAVEICAFYCVAELLTNTAKHASASRAGVKAAVHGNNLQICVSDDGRGGADQDRGSGLTGISDRVEALGGAFSVSSYPGTGTRISIELPTEIGDL